VLAQDSDSPKIRPLPQLQPHHQGTAMPSAVGQAHLHDSARHGDAFDGQQILERKMQADTEHQQHDADL
jgi:hypothetical protein